MFCLATFERSSVKLSKRCDAGKDRHCPRDVHSRWQRGQDPPSVAAGCVRVGAPRSLMRLDEYSPTRSSYTRIQGTLKNLGYDVARTTVAKVLKDNRIPPAPGRPSSWRTYGFLWRAIGYSVRLGNVDFRPAGSMMAGMITLILIGLLRGNRTHRALVLENLALRHPLAVLQRSAPRLRLRRPTGCSGSCCPACGAAGRMASPLSNPPPSLGGSGPASRLGVGLDGRGDPLGVSPIEFFTDRLQRGAAHTR